MCYNTFEVDIVGIIVNALSISAGAFLGGIFKEKVKFKNFSILGIAIMLISLVGFFENIFDVDGPALESDGLLVVVFALIIGTVLGDLLHLDSRISNLSGKNSKGFCDVLDATVFFGVGGMQICGPLMLATVGDSSQLILKSMIDFPFALMFGISCGKKTALSALPVALVQIIIVALAFFSKDFLDTYVIKQTCAMGYIILFFSGFNLICDKNHKINNINMLIGIVIILLYNVLRRLWG